MIWQSHPTPELIRIIGGWMTIMTKSGELSVLELLTGQNSPVQLHYESDDMIAP